MDISYKEMLGHSMKNQHKQIDKNGKSLRKAIQSAVKKLYLFKDRFFNSNEEYSKNVVTVINNPYELDAENRNRKLQEALEKKQVGDFILENPKDYVFEDERVTYERSKEDLFAYNVSKKYQDLLDNIRKAEGISRKDIRYTKFRYDLQQIQITKE